MATSVESWRSAAGARYCRRRRHVCRRDVVCSRLPRDQLVAPAKARICQRACRAQGFSTWVQGTGYADAELDESCGNLKGTDAVPLLSNFHASQDVVSLLSNFHVRRMQFPYYQTFMLRNYLDALPALPPSKHLSINVPSAIIRPADIRRRCLPFLQRREILHPLVVAVRWTKGVRACILR